MTVDALLRISTDAVLVHDRVGFCREEFGREVLGVDFDPLHDAPVHAEMKLHPTAGV